MNAPLLILPALVLTMAFSAAKTLPPDLRHDAQGKAPLTVARMAATRGAGSTCRLGCNEPDVACHRIGGAPYPSDDPGAVTGWQMQVWNKHMECGFAWGSDTCIPGPDTICNRVYTYASHTPCAGDPTIDVTTSSTCIVIDDAPDPGPIDGDPTLPPLSPKGQP